MFLIFKKSKQAKQEITKARQKQSKEIESVRLPLLQLLSPRQRHQKFADGYGSVVINRRLSPQEEGE